MALRRIYPDADQHNADWTKQTWDLPPYKSAEFFQLYTPEDLPTFRESPAYKHAVEQGLIFDDEWVDDHVQPA